MKADMVERFSMTSIAVLAALSGCAAEAAPPIRILPGRYECAAMTMRGTYGPIVNSQGMVYGWQSVPSLGPSVLNGLTIESTGAYRFAFRADAKGTLRYDSSTGGLSGTGPIGEFATANYAWRTMEFTFQLERDGQKHFCSLPSQKVETGTASPRADPYFTRKGQSSISLSYDGVQGNGASAAVIADFNRKLTANGGKPNILSDVWVEVFSTLLELRDGGAYRPTAQSRAAARTYSSADLSHSASWSKLNDFARQSNADMLILNTWRLQQLRASMTAPQLATEADYLIDIYFLDDETRQLERLLKGR
jgi:hypothetical protein